MCSVTFILYFYYTFVASNKFMEKIINIPNILIK